MKRTAAEQRVIVASKAWRRCLRAAVAYTRALDHIGGELIAAYGVGEVDLALAEKELEEAFLAWQEARKP